MVIIITIGKIKSLAISAFVPLLFSRILTIHFEKIDINDQSTNRQNVKASITLIYFTLKPFKIELIKYKNDIAFLSFSRLVV